MVSVITPIAIFALNLLLDSIVSLAEKGWSLSMENVRNNAQANGTLKGGSAKNAPLIAKIALVLLTRNA